MSILGSFNIGVTGLNSLGDGMSVFADNIANAGTNGFKKSQAEFQDVLSKSLKGIDGGDQIGAGSKLAHVKPIFSQGSIVRTENVTDLAINGNGFFVIDAAYGRGFSRDGSFHFDNQGHLINGDGYTVLGFDADEDNQITNRLAPIRLGGTNIPARATSKIKMQMNLDSRSDVKKFSMENPDKTSHFNTSVVVYDNVGTARLVSVFFTKTKDSTWEYHALVKGEDAQGGADEKFVEMGNGTVEFNEKGVLKKTTTDSSSFNFNKGAASGQKIEFDFGPTLEDGGITQDSSTQYGSEPSLTRHTQNGASAATLASLSFNDKGVLSAVYNNGEIRDIAQIAVAKFDNNEDLFKMGKNLFKETRKSGQAALGRPQEGGRGEVLSKSIEESNVDIAQEFVSLMKAQKNFTANTRTITTADQMLQEVLNIKR